MNSHANSSHCPNHHYKPSPQTHSTMCAHNFEHRDRKRPIHKPKHDTKYIHKIRLLGTLLKNIIRNLLPQTYEVKEPKIRQFRNHIDEIGSWSSKGGEAR